MTPQSIFVEQFVDSGLGNSAYLVGSREAKIAVLIDPLRDVDRYVAAAEKNGVKIYCVVDTHLHADFVSGSREVAARTGATIGASAEARVGFSHRPLIDGDHVWLGDMILQVCATPGHTPEHISFLLRETRTKSPVALFSGGALIVGGAARTDLLGHERSRPLARRLYRTIHGRLLALDDDVAVYPTHGAGSFCVTPARPERTTTIGRERTSNPLAQPQSEEEFVERALTGLPSYPDYYHHLRPVNQCGPDLLRDLPRLAPRSPGEVREWIEGGGCVLDARPGRAFRERHAPGSYGIPLSTPLITWAGWLIPFGTPLVLVAEGERDRAEAVRQLLCIGYDDLRGYLEGGMDAWEAADLPLGRVREVSVEELHDRLASGSAPAVLDVRQDSEWEAGHIPGAVHVENGRLPYGALPLPADRAIAVHCQHGDRSTAGLSVLARRGHRDLLFVDGGFAAWEAAGYDVERGPGAGRDD